MFFFSKILPRIHKSHAADPNGSADPRLGTPALNLIMRESDSYSFLIWIALMYLYISKKSPSNLTIQNWFLIFLKPFFRFI